MNDRSDHGLRRGCHTCGLHKFVVADPRVPAAYGGFNALAGALGHIIGFFGAVLFGACAAQRLGYRVRGEALGDGGDAGKLIGVNSVRGVYAGHGKRTFGQCAGFVKHGGRKGGKLFKIVSTLDKYSLARGASDAAEE